VGILNRLFNRTSTLPRATGTKSASSLDASLYTGNETLEVVGESHYQNELWDIVAATRGDRVRYHTHAVLIPDEDNSYDPNAIKILIDGNLVGYLSREDAVIYRPGLLGLIESSVNGLVALDATIAGGGQRPDGPGRLGVFLDHDPADFGIKPQQAAGAGFRTGLSEAMATDLEDDSYDLSWYRELSGNDVAAIRQLRTMLKTETDLIDRHYLMSELEKRLYRSRDAFSSALDEFDVVCQQHDGEMATIRPAIFDKFGKIPLIDTYRQAAVRCQKARDWPTMRDWAERGITVYGEHAARPEAVDDLRKRREYAIAKIEAANEPKRPRQTKVVVTTVTPAQGGEIETLVCAQCGTTFQRTRTRGRKPHTCSACRGV
jgi:hypothetical protein